jgi:hypothetical protein
VNRAKGAEAVHDSVIKPYPETVMTILPRAIAIPSKATAPPCDHRRAVISGYSRIGCGVTQAAIAGAECNFLRADHCSNPLILAARVTAQVAIRSCTGAHPEVESGDITIVNSAIVAMLSSNNCGSTGLQIKHIFSTCVMILAG